MTGAVQGVGMRPFVHRLAEELGLAGFVGNDGAGAFAEVEGPESRLAEFAQRVVSEAPPLARIESLQSTPMPVTGAATFGIVA